METSPAPRLEAGAILFAGQEVLYADGAARALLDAAAVGEVEVWPRLEAELERFTSRGAASPTPAGRVHPLLDDGRWIRARWVTINDCPVPLRLLLVSLVPPPTSRAHVEAEAVRVGLTPRELEVCLLALQGRSNSEIALALGCAASTVRLHLVNAYRKAGICGRTELAARFLAPWLPAVTPAGGRGPAGGRRGPCGQRRAPCDRGC